MKKLFIALLALLLVFSFASCKKKEEEPAASADIQTPADLVENGGIVLEDGFETPIIFRN